MATGIHPAAPHHLPPFITAPGETDYFFNGSVIFLLVLVILAGTLYFRLHALPEHLAHDSESKLQFQLVGVLALLALFTHNAAFWVAALILALVRIPDLTTPLGAIADSLARMARWRRAGTSDESAVLASEESAPARLRLTSADNSQPAESAALSGALEADAPGRPGPAVSASGSEAHPLPDAVAEARARAAERA